MANHALTETFLYETAPQFFSVESETQIKDAYEEYIGRVLELTGIPGGAESGFSWETAEAISYEQHGDDFTNPTSVTVSASMLHTRINGVGRPLHLTTTRGSLIVVDKGGNLVAAHSEHNPKVDQSYGDPAPYVLEKLGWAKVAEVLAKQGGDWGEGYQVLTEFLRSIGRVATDKLPHVGMATAHEIPYSEETKGTDRNALAYASASNYTLNPVAAYRLLENRNYFQMYLRDAQRGLFDNVADWLAGRVDTLVADAANKTYLGQEVPLDFPDLTDPDYFYIDNN